MLMQAYYYLFYWIDQDLVCSIEFRFFWLGCAAMICNCLLQMFRALPKQPPSKNHPRNVLHYKNHFDATILVHVTWNTALKHENAYWWPDIDFFKIAKTWNQFVSLTHWPLTRYPSHYLTTVTSLEPKRRSKWPPFYATTTNSPVRCAFWVPTMFVLSSIRLFFMQRNHMC